MPDVRQFTHETEHSVVPPSFDTIVARRRERTRNRLIVAAAGCLAVIVAVVGIMSSGWQNRAAPIPATPPGISDADRWLSFGSPFGVEAVRPGGTGQHVLLSKLDGDPHDLSWDHDGRRVVWVSIEADVTRDIWVGDVVNGEVSGSRRLVNCLAPCTHTEAPAFSPDGRWISFSSYKEAAGEIRIVDSRTGVSRRSIPMELGHWAPVWSPDSRQLAMSVVRPEASVGGGLPTIGIIDVEAANPALRLLDTGKDNAHDVAWSPDGALLVYVDGPDETFSDGGDLVTVRPDGSGRRKVTRQPGGMGLTGPSWSADGRAIFATQGAPADNSQVCRVDVATGAVTLLLDRLGNSFRGWYVRLG